MSLHPPPNMAAYGALHGSNGSQERTTHPRILAASFIVAGACCMGLLVLCIALPWGSSRTELLVPSYDSHAGSAWPDAPQPASDGFNGESIARAWRHGIQSPVQNSVEDEVESRIEALNKIKQAISQEHKHLLLMRKQEQELTKKHDEIAAQVAHLQRTSHASASDIHNLRNRYEYRVNEMQAEYRRHSEALEEARMDSRRRIRNLEEEAATLGTGTARDLARADYYRGQDETADKAIAVMQNKVNIADQKYDLARQDLDKARLESLDRRVSEAEAIAKEKAELLVSEQNGNLNRKVSRAKKDLQRARQDLTAETAKSEAEVALAYEAKALLAKDESVHDELSTKVDAQRAEYRGEVEKTQDLMSQADMAEDHARLLTRQAEAGKADLADLQSEERDKWDYAQEAIKQVETAEGNEAIAKTRGAVAHRMSQDDVEHADRVKARIARELQDSDDRLLTAEKERKEMIERKEQAMVSAVQSIGHAKKGDSELEIAEARRHTSRESARIMRDSARRKEKQAEGLMHSLGALAALARQAARVADASRMRAEKAADISAWCGDGPCTAQKLAAPFASARAAAPQLRRH